MSRLWLIGMTGVGKSSAGRVAASLLGVPFSDSDEMVETAAGRSVGAIWEDGGESAFRRIERQVMEDLGSAHGVIATGGGAPLDPRSRQFMEGEIVLLEASLGVLCQRLENTAERPLLSGGDLRARATALIEERSPVYVSLATARIDTDDLGIEEVAEKVASLWPG